MNDRQLEFMKSIISLEKEDAARYEHESEEIRQRKKESWHRYGMEELVRLAKPINPHPPRKLTRKPCKKECIFCHPKLLKMTGKKFKKNLSGG